MSEFAAVVGSGGLAALPSHLTAWCTQKRDRENGGVVFDKQALDVVTVTFEKTGAQNFELERRYCDASVFLLI